MTKNKNPEIPAGWIGGFAESDERFAYPTRDLGSLDMLKNMDNIGLLQRQQAILWPEFSWNTKPNAADPKRCFQMFAPDISRVGYTDQGRVYSIICPQQGIESPSLGSINVEITVTGQRGWVDEDTRALACDMSVEARVWFGHGYHENATVKLLWKVIEGLGHEFPISKDKAIVVSTPSQDILTNRSSNCRKARLLDSTRPHLPAMPTRHGRSGTLRSRSVPLSNRAALWPTNSIDYSWRF